MAARGGYKSSFGGTVDKHKLRLSTVPAAYLEGCVYSQCRCVQLGRTDAGHATILNILYSTVCTDTSSPKDRRQKPAAAVADASADAAIHQSGFIAAARLVQEKCIHSVDGWVATDGGEQWELCTIRSGHHILHCVCGARH